MLLAWQRSSTTSGDVAWQFLPIDMLLLTYCLLLSSPECTGLFCSLNAFTDGRRKVEKEECRQYYSPGKPRLDSGFLIYRFRTKLNVCSSFQGAIFAKAAGSIEELPERSWSEIG